MARASRVGPVGRHAMRKRVGHGPPTVLVYLDDRAMGDVGTLHDTPTAGIEYIEYFPFAQAMGRFPEFTHGAGVIQVSTRPRKGGG